MNPIRHVIKPSPKLVSVTTLGECRGSLVSQYWTQIVHLRDRDTFDTPQPGENFTLVQPNEISPLDSTDLVGGSECFTNYRVEWRGCTVTIQQFQGIHAQDRFEEHLAVIRLLRDSSVPVGWVAGVSSSPSAAPFILYHASSILDDLKPRVKASLKSYINIPNKKRITDHQAWSKANNIDNFFRHLDPTSFQKILSSET